VQGQRIYCDGEGRFFLNRECQGVPMSECRPGDYWHYAPIGWACKLPNGLRAGISKHNVEEHEDGTITVTPSILCIEYSHGFDWHGHLTRGVFMEC
jgi:hypothetical protein